MPLTDRRTFLRGALATSVAGPSLLVAACGSSGDAGGGTAATSLTIGVESDPKSLSEIIDPGVGIRLLAQTQDGLLNRSRDYKSIVPGIATALPKHPDDRTYVFTLRDGVVFHDGTPVTADDVVYTFKRLMTDKTVTFGVLYSTNIEKVTAKDDKTVEFKLKNPWPIFLSLMSGNHAKIVNRKVVERAGYGTKHWSGTGPFEVTEWIKGNRVTLERARHANSPQGKAKLAKIDVRTILDPQARVAALKSGQIDVLLEPDLKDVQQFKSDSRFNVVETSGALMTLVFFKTSIPPFDKPEVRKAISLAIDREALVDSFFYGHGSAAGDLFPDWHWAHDDGIRVVRDVEQARQLLKRAGFDGKPLSFTAFVKNSKDVVDQATAVQAQLEEAGIEMKISPMEYTTQAALLTKGPEEWPSPVAIAQIEPLRGTAYEFSLYEYGSIGPLNFTDFNKPGGRQRPDVEKLMNRAAALSDVDDEHNAQAKPLWAEVSKLLNDDPPQLRLTFKNRVDITTSDVDDWKAAIFDASGWAPVSRRA